MSQVLDSEPKPPIPIPQPRPEPAVEFPPQTFPSSEERLDLPKNIIVNKFEFDGNTAFSDEKLTKVTAQFTKRSLTFVELLQVEATITKLYTDAGYLNCDAVIPAGQTLSQQGSVVKIQIIEGGLEEIAVTGTRRLNSNYIRSRLAIATARPLNQKRLLSALQLLQLDPLIQNISTELSAGSRPELSLLTVKVVEADSFHTQFFLDNARALDKYPRQLADVNGDGRADIVGFGYDNVLVSLGQSNGTFGPASVAISDNFTVNKGGWTSFDKYPRQLADVNGDGKADIVGFGYDNVLVSLGQSNGTFGPASVAISDDFTVNKGGWTSFDKYPRQLADVNGDGTFYRSLYPLRHEPISL